MSSIVSNLFHSTVACSYVNKAISMGGANWDQYSGSGSWEDCFLAKKKKEVCEALKDPVDICLYDKTRPVYMAKIAKVKKMIEKLEIIANAAKKRKCGNCGEFSALAFMYLYHEGVRPLDWMSLVGGDHAFVVIGRQHKSDVNNILTWGGKAAICDPWGQGFRSGDKKTGTYPASTFQARMGSLVSYRGVMSRHREN